jgi:hypothetical protein
MINICIQDFESYIINAILLMTALAAHANHHSLFETIMIFLVIFNIVMFALSQNKTFACHVSLEDDRNE